MLVCKLCSRECKSLLSLKTHLRRAHKVNHQDYLIQYELNGKTPLCKCGCGNPTKYFRGAFKEYLQGHFLRANGEYLHNKEIRSRIENTNKNKYGGVSPASSKEVVSKAKRTCLEKYGVEHPMYSEEVKNKIRNTNFQRYGFEHAGKSEEVKNKREQTNLKLYGVKNVFERTDIRQKIQSNIRLSYDKIIEICSVKSYIPLFDELTYQSCREFYSFKCLEHNVIFESSIFNISAENCNQCPKCQIKGTSKVEKELFEFVFKLNVNSQHKNRSVIPPKELDVFIPDKNLAIEYHGLYWHSEAFDKFSGKDKHYLKFINCKDKGIKLVQFFEDEWRDKQDICKSIIKNSLGLSDVRINARDCAVIEDFSQEKLFVDANHLQGHTFSLKNFTLVHKSGPVMIVTLRKPFTNKGYSVEIARVVTKVGCIVRGGFSRLMKYVKQWSIEQGFKQILTYSDCRYSWGNVYEKYGFKFVKHTGIDYFYTDLNKRINRYKFRAQHDRTEKEIADQNKVFKIYGAGHYLWSYNI